MSNEAIAKNVDRKTNPFSDVSLEDWSRIYELCHLIEGKTLMAVQEMLLDFHKNRLVDTLVDIAGSERHPKNINPDIYAGLLRGIKSASLRDIGRIAAEKIDAARSKAEAAKKREAEDSSKLPSNSLI